MREPGIGSLCLLANVSLITILPTYHAFHHHTTRSAWACRRPCILAQRCHQDLQFQKPLIPLDDSHTAHHPIPFWRPPTCASEWRASATAGGPGTGATAASWWRRGWPGSCEEHGAVEG
jgi:hypothetical protein